MPIEDLAPETVKLYNGTVLNYVRDGEGVTLVFIHGGMQDLRSWTAQWDTFVEQFDCVAYSRRYNHPNPNPMNSRDYSPLIDVEDLEALMDALGIDAAILVGSGFGAFSALAMADQLPERVLGIVAVEPPMLKYAYATPEGAAIADAFLATSVMPARTAFERGDDAAGVRLVVSGIKGISPRSIGKDELAALMENVAAAKSMSLSRDEFPLISEESLAALEMPVLLISGARTAPIHGAIFKSVAAAMPQAMFAIIDGCGHAVPQQQPELFNDEVLTFLEQTVMTIPAA